MLMCGFIYSQNTNHSLELEQTNEEYFELNAPFFESYWYGTGDHNQFSIMCWVKIKENSVDEQVIFYIKPLAILILNYLLMKTNFVFI